MFGALIAKVIPGVAIGLAKDIVIELSDDDDNDTENPVTIFDKLEKKRKEKKRNERRS